MKKFYYKAWLGVKDKDGRIHTETRMLELPGEKPLTDNKALFEMRWRGMIPKGASVKGFGRIADPATMQSYRVEYEYNGKLRSLVMDIPKDISPLGKSTRIMGHLPKGAIYAGSTPVTRFGGER